MAKRDIEMLAGGGKVLEQVIVVGAWVEAEACAARRLLVHAITHREVLAGGILDDLGLFALGLADILASLRAHGAQQGVLGLRQVNRVGLGHLYRRGAGVKVRARQRVWRAARP